MHHFRRDAIVSAAGYVGLTVRGTFAIKGRVEYQNHAFLQHSPSTGVRQPKKGVQAKDVDLRSIPPVPVTNLDIDITEGCNLACSYCFKGELEGNHMSLETLKQCYDWLSAASRGAEQINFNFMGGEPTMRWKEIRAFVPWARRRSLAEGKLATFSMTSNLTLWTDEIRDFVDKYGFGILMSIDGCPDVQDAQRPAKNGRPMSETVERWAKSLLRTRQRSTARMTLSPHYVGRFRESVAYLVEIGFSEVTVGTADYGSWSMLDLATFREQLAGIVEDIGQSYTGAKPFQMTVLKYLVDHVVRHRREGKPERIERRDSPCGAGKGYLMVDHTGDIWPCHRFDGADQDVGAEGSMRMGNIYQPGFHTSLQQAFLEFDHSKKRKESCDTCPVDPVCGGFCPAANLQDSGNIYTPHDGYCVLSQGFYRAADHLYSLAAGGGFLDRLLKDCEGTDSDGR